jgi:hypothetical protein
VVDHTWRLFRPCKMSKGNQRPRFEEIQRGDPGRDGGGIYRNIARETRIPNILTKGKYSTLEWPEICKLFTSKPTDERVQVPNTSFTGFFIFNSWIPGLFS